MQSSVDVSLAGTPPETHYAQSGDLTIAYQVVGDGPLDLVLVPGWVSHVEYAWEEPRLARFYRRLASFSRLILFDKRGTGLSDRAPALPTLEERMDDVRAVMDAAGSNQAALIGVSEGGPLCALFAAAHPERVCALVMCGTYAKRGRTTEYPWGPDTAELERWFNEIRQRWGGPVGLETFAPSVADDQAFRRWYGTYLRLGASPGAVFALARMNARIDIRHVLPSIRVPTLVIHRTDDLAVTVDEGRYIAGHIPDVKLIELPGVDHLPWVGDADTLLDEVEEFLTGARQGPEPDRMLATVLFCDIVDSTARASSLGDQRWRDLLEQHYALVRRELARFRGREIDDAGDGFLAIFDGPARAIGCAQAITAAVRQLGIELRAGLHTGECEMVGRSVRGIAVHTGSRVAAEAQPNEILVTRTVVDLVAGSGIRFQDRGIRTLRGIPGEWRLFAPELP